MMILHIDNIEVEVAEGTLVIEAAAQAGIHIPSMCYLKGTKCDASCMVCMVKDEPTGKFFPSCAMPVSDGMKILTNDPEVHEMRKQALELLLSDHVGDCEAPCRLACPAYMNIPLMNRLIADGKFDEALQEVYNEIPLPYVLGYICPAPCEKVCHRATHDTAVSICLLKRSTVQFGDKTPPPLLKERGPGGEVKLPTESGVEVKLPTVPGGEVKQPTGPGGEVKLPTEPGGEVKQPTGPGGEVKLPTEPGGEVKLPTGPGGEVKKVAIIGSGPAGLSAAFYLLRLGYQVDLFEQESAPGGRLRSSIPEEQLPREVLESEIATIQSMGACFYTNETIVERRFQELLESYDAMVLAMGKLETLPFGLLVDGKHGTTSHPKVFVAGDPTHAAKMAVKSVAQGHLAALQVDHFLSKGDEKTDPKEISIRKFKFHSIVGRITQTEYEEYLKESVAAPRTTPAQGFLSGFSREEAIREAQRCMHCDCRKSETCKLRIYSDAYHADRHRFSGPHRKSVTKSMQHEFVVYESEKCIRCGLCVEISKRDEQALGMTYIGRGFDVRIAVPFREELHDALKATAETCILYCPTGALALKKEGEIQ